MERRSKSICNFAKETSKPSGKKEKIHKCQSLPSIIKLPKDDKAKISSSTSTDQLFSHKNYKRPVETPSPEQVGDCPNFEAADTTSCNSHSQLENKILVDKLREYGRLSEFNQKLVSENEKKEKDLRELSSRLSGEIIVGLKNRMKIQELKEKVGDCNVQIQNLKKELSILQKKCLNKQTTIKRNNNLSFIEAHRNQKLEKCAPKLNNFKF